MRRTLTQPTLGTRTADQRRLSFRIRSARAPTTRNPSCRPRRRHVGRPWVPAKKPRHAWSRSRRACCCTVCEPPASHGFAFRASVSWAACPSYPGVGPFHRRHIGRCSSPRFHTYRACPHCSSRSTSCTAVGYNRNRDTCSNLASATDTPPGARPRPSTPPAPAAGAHPDDSTAPAPPDTRGHRPTAPRPTAPRPTAPRPTAPRRATERHRRSSRSSPVDRRDQTKQALPPGPQGPGFRTQILR